MQRSDFEIMAPAGSRETLAAALQAGADSVYFGIGALNMRAHSAGGFTIDDLNDSRLPLPTIRPVQTRFRFGYVCRHT